MSFPWDVVEESGSAADLHTGSAAEVAQSSPHRLVRVLGAVKPALVLGSGQAESDFDSAAVARSGLDVVRRRSGGGAVIVGPGRVVWVDFLLPRGDPWWDDDVGRAAWWVGELWSAALADAGVDPGALEVWKGPMVPSGLARQVCFAGLGPGEVRIAGKKAVGVSQKRTRQAVLFQTAAVLEWVPRDYATLMTDGERALPDLERSVTGVGAGIERRLLAALRSSLS